MRSSGFQRLTRPAARRRTGERIALRALVLLIVFGATASCANLSSSTDSDSEEVVRKIAGEWAYTEIPRFASDAELDIQVRCFTDLTDSTEPHVRLTYTTDRGTATVRSFYDAGFLREGWDRVGTTRTADSVSVEYRKLVGEAVVDTVVSTYGRSVSVESRVTSPSPC